MNEALPRLTQTTLSDIPSAISLLESEFGLMLSAERDGQTTDLFGREVAPAKVSLPLENNSDSKTLVISGQVGSDSSESASLQLSLENKLLQQLGTAGSTLFKLTWKEKVTPLGKRYLVRQASARRISDKDCGSWPTANNSTGSGVEGREGGLNLQTAMATWATPRSTEAGHSSGNPERALDRKSRLEDQVFLVGSWATLAARDYRSESATEEYNQKRWNHPRGKPLSAQVLLTDSGPEQTGSHAKTASGGQLNPELSRWLMGLPINWTLESPSRVSRGRSSSRVTATPSAPLSPPNSSPPTCLRCEGWGMYMGKIAHVSRKRTDWLRMRLIPCNYEHCGRRRRHHDDPYTERGTQMIQVPDDFVGDVAYCSIECAAYAGTGILKIDKENSNG